MTDLREWNGLTCNCKFGCKRKQGQADKYQRLRLGSSTMLAVWTNCNIVSLPVRSITMWDAKFPIQIVLKDLFISDLEFYCSLACRRWFMPTVWTIETSLQRVHVTCLEQIMLQYMRWDIEDAFFVYYTLRHITRCRSTAMARTLSISRKQDSVGSYHIVVCREFHPWSSA